MIPFVSVSLTIKVPFSFGCIPSSWLSSGFKATPSNKKIGQSVDGNTSTVYINPLNSLRFVLNELKKDKVNLDKDFYVFTGSTVGVVPILGKGLYTGKVAQLGSAKAIIH